MDACMLRMASIWRPADARWILNGVQFLIRTMKLSGPFPTQITQSKLGELPYNSDAIAQPIEGTSKGEVGPGP